MTAEQKRQIGGDLLPTPPDERDFSLGDIFTQIDIKEVPDTDWEILTEKIKDQGQTDLCTAYAICSASEAQEGLPLDPIYQFSKIKQLTGDFMAWGADLRSAMKSAVKFGSIRPEDSLYTISDDRNVYANWKTWTKEVDDLARPYQKKSFFKMHEGRYDTFDNIRSFLYQFRGENRIGVTGTLWRPGWTEGVIPKEPMSGGGGHAVAVVGQKMIGGEPYLKIQNSYGEKFGDNGYNYFPREVVNREFTYGTYMFQDKDPEKVKQIYQLKQLILNGSNMPTKPALQSQTIIGALKVGVPVVVMILAYLGVEITPEESNSFLDLVEKLLTAGLGLWGLYDIVVGRFNAKTPLKGIFK